MRTPALRILLPSLCAIAAPAMTSVSWAQPLVLGAIGDSLTDEYSEETYSYAKNWAMQVVQHRGVNMGPTAQAAGRPGNSWGEPRRAGNEFNWARYGADSTTAIADGQASGLAAQVTGAGVTHAVVAIGANDFSPTTSAYFNIYFGLWSTATTTNYVNSQITDIRSIVTTLKGAGANVLLANVVDFGLAPATRSVYSNASRRQRVGDAVAQVNVGVKSLARNQRVMMIDLAALAGTILGPHTAPRQFLTIAGQNIQLLNRDTATNSNPLAGFVDDGAHPHTAVQGVFANVMIAAINQSGNQSGTFNIAPFSESEIVTNASLAPIGPDALPAQIGSYSDYLYDFRCTANFNGVGGVSIQDLFDFLAAYFAGSLDADANRDNMVSVQDIFDLLAAWFAGC